MNNKLRIKLDNIFATLWSMSEPIEGIWKADAHSNHRIYIHRGHCLVQGNTVFTYLDILVPNGIAGEMKLTPVIGDSCAHMDITPKLENGEFVRINRDDSGSWEAFLDREADLILLTLKRIAQERQDETENEHQKALEERQSKLKKVNQLFE